MDRAALEAVRDWVFLPAMLGDQPVAVYYSLSVTFGSSRIYGH